MAFSKLKILTAIRGYHIYKDFWTPEIGDIFPSGREEGNAHDFYGSSGTDRWSFSSLEEMLFGRIHRFRLKLQ